MVGTGPDLHRATYTHTHTFSVIYCIAINYVYLQSLFIYHCIVFCVTTLYRLFSLLCYLSLNADNNDVMSNCQSHCSCVTKAYSIAISLLQLYFLNLDLRCYTSYIATNTKTLVFTMVAMLTSPVIIAMLTGYNNSVSILMCMSDTIIFYYKATNCKFLVSCHPPAQ